jgi:hypothetical protein
MSCHTNAHSSQVSLFTGENGFDVEKTPSVMYMNGINCKGCHIFHEVSKRDIETSIAGAGSCEKCHGAGYDKLLKQWEVASVKRIAVIKSIYNVVDRQLKNLNSEKKAETDQILAEAEHNIKIVEIGKSVHNIQFADKLLMAAYGLLKKALTVAGTPAKLPEFTSASDFIPNECYNCHSGIQEITIRKFDMNFSHNQHIVKERIVCSKCHSNQQKHGELVASKESCNSCHHAQGKNNDACANCHTFQSDIFSGKYYGKDQPDYMKAGGVNCIDCHASGDKILKPDNTICLKCHEDSYKQMAVDWKNDISKLLKEADAEMKKTKDMNLNSDQQALVAETRKIVNDISSHPGIYVHNYDMLSTVLSEKIKKLKAFK